MAEWTQWTTWFYGWAMERLPLLLDLSIRLGFILLLAWGLRLAARRAINLVYAALKNRTDCSEDVKRIDTLVRVARFAALRLSLHFVFFKRNGVVFDKVPSQGDWWSVGAGWMIG